ncbi:MAG: hypothetical protein WC467_04020 [Patescibacteria group bacterium]
MKRILVISVKILLPLLFLYNVGFFSLDFSGYFKDLRKSEPFNPEGQLKLTKFVNEKVKLAKAKGNKYSPDDYFNDLYEVTKLKKSLKGVMNNCNFELLSLSQENLKKGFFDNKDVDAARSVYKEKIDPGSEEREKLKVEMTKKYFWPNVRIWLWHFYLKNLPLAFILFLFWWYQEKNNLKISNPLSFVISLIFYPLTIALVIREALSEKSRYYLAEAELRRTKKKMFSMLSTNEVDDLRRFAKSRGISLKDWKAYLQNQELEAQHLLVPSLLVTLFLVSIPRVSFSQESSPSLSSSIFMTQVLTINAEAPPNEKFQTENISQSKDFSAFSSSFTLNLAELYKTISALTLIIAWIKKIRPQEVLRKIDHVPCFSF